MFESNIFTHKKIVNSGWIINEVSEEITTKSWSSTKFNPESLVLVMLILKALRIP